MLKPILMALSVVILAACSGPPELVHNGSPYSVDINRDGKQVFGTAGSALSDEELKKAIASRTVCNDAKEVRNLEVKRSATGVIGFTGVCA